MSELHEEFRPEDYKLCHGCGALVRLQAQKCRFCGELQIGFYSLPKLVDNCAKIIRKASKNIADDNVRLCREDESGFLRKETAKVLVYFVMGIVLSASIIYIFDRGTLFLFNDILPSKLFVVIFALVLIASISLTCFYFFPRAADYLLNDMLFFLRSRKNTPEGTLNAFFYGLKYGRLGFSSSIVLYSYFRPENSFYAFKSCWGRFIANEIHVPPVYKVSFKNVEYINSYNAIVTVRFTFLENRSSYGCLILLGLLIGVLVCIYEFPLMLFPLFAFTLVAAKKFYSSLEQITLIKWMRKICEQWYIVEELSISGADMLPKLYHDCMERLEFNQLPPLAAMKEAAFISGEETG